MAVRDRGLLSAELDAIADELADEDDPRYRSRLTGAQEALLWLMGRRATSPVSRALIETPGQSEGYHEAVRADEVTSGVRPLPQGLTRDYAGGVAAALMWAVEQTSEPPSPLPDGNPMRARVELERAYEANVALAQSPPTHWGTADRSEQDGVVAALGWLVGHGSSPVSRRARGVIDVVDHDRSVVAEEMEMASRLSAPRPQRMASHATSLVASTTPWPGRWPPGTASQARPSELQLSH